MGFFRRRQERDGDKATVVIGTQMAAAMEAEERHQAVSRGPSPLAGVGYALDLHEFDLFRFVESETDQQVAAVVTDAHSGDADLGDMRSTLTQDELYVLLAFGRRQALAALREGEPALVAQGLQAIALIDLERVDWRDAAVAAGLLAYAGDRLGLHMADLVQPIALRAEPNVAELLQTYVSSPGDGLGAGGYREVRTSAGTGFASDWGAPFDPRSNLLGAAEAVMTLVEEDRYRVDGLTTGVDVPEVWFPAADSAARAALGRVRAAVSVSASPRDEGRGMSDQMFTIWIIESGDASDAKHLANAARPKPKSETAILGVSAGVLVAVLVARSVVMGVRPIEDQRSVERFRAGLVRALLAIGDGNR